MPRCFRAVTESTTLRATSELDYCSCTTGILSRLALSLFASHKPPAPLLSEQESTCSHCCMCCSAATKRTRQTCCHQHKRRASIYLCACVGCSTAFLGCGRLHSAPSQVLPLPRCVGSSKRVEAAAFFLPRSQTRCFVACVGCVPVALSTPFKQPPSVKAKRGSIFKFCRGLSTFYTAGVQRVARRL